jgi:elongation factor Ts
MDIKLVKQLREKTGASMIECQKAVDEAKGDLVKAEEILRKKGQKIVDKKAGRETKFGIIGVYLHSNEKVTGLVSISCETDFVARNAEFKELAHDLAMQVVAAHPTYLTPEDIPTEILAKEKEIYSAELKKEKKPEAMINKILEGKLAKFFEEQCLMKQKFIKDDKSTVEDLVKAKIAKLGENIKVKKFFKFEI